MAFDMYQDPEVAQIIRKLDERKREAVQRERYDHAKKLKQAIADLQKVLPGWATRVPLSGLSAITAVGSCELWVGMGSEVSSRES